MSYHAFISYSHAQHAVQARRIHRMLSRYATPWYQRRRLRLFMDDANLPATPSLWDSIESALAQSDHLIFLASPAAANSPWCAREIHYWRANKPAGHIILVLLKGRIRWDADRSDFDWRQTDCLPREMGQGLFENEPRYIDLSRIDFKTTGDDAALKTRLADIASVLLNMPKDDLIGEDLMLQKRNLRLAWGSVAVLLAVSSIALWQRHEATVQRDLAQERLEQALEISEKMLFDIDEKLAGVAGTGELRRSLTYDAQSLLSDLRIKAAGDEAVDWARMTGFYQQGNLALRLGDLTEAENAFSEAQKLAAAMVEAQPGYVEPYHSWALAYHALGKVRGSQQRYPEAYDNFDRAKQLADFLLEDDPQDEDGLLLLLNIYQDWGDVAYAQRDIPVAHQNFSAGIQLIGGLVGKYPDDAEYLFLYALMLDRKALYYPLHSDPKKRLDTLEETVDILARLVESFPDVAKYRLNLSLAYEKLGEVALFVDNLAGAKTYYSAAVLQLQALFTAEPYNNLYKRMLATDYGNLGQVLMKLGEQQKALELLSQEHAWSQALHHIDPQNIDYEFDYIISMQHLGDYYGHIDKAPEATDYLRRAISKTQSLLERLQDSRRAHLLLASMRNNLAELLIDSQAEQGKDVLNTAAVELANWLQANQRDDEGWLYMAQLRNNQFVHAMISGDSQLLNGLKDDAMAALANISADARKKYAMEIDDILRRLDEPENGTQ